MPPERKYNQANLSGSHKGVGKKLGTIIQNPYTIVLTWFHVGKMGRKMVGNGKENKWKAWHISISSEIDYDCNVKNYSNGFRVEAQPGNPGKPNAR